jgi:ComF family protein
MLPLDLPAESSPLLPPRRWLPQLPSQCEVCRLWGRLQVCSSCTQRFAAPVPRCACCGLKLGVAQARCGDCLQHPPPFVHTVCAADYGFPWDDLVTRFKFHQQPELARALAAVLAQAVHHSGLPLPQQVLPVPLAAPRLAQRGYNQAWELARRVAHSLQLPAQASLLWRVLDTPHQANLARAERQHNLRGAFMVNPTALAQCAGQHLALVDDVMTTGATLREAAAALMQAGAAQVDVWVLARTPRGD